MSLYEKINPVLPEYVHENIRRIILFDPIELYPRITINKYSRQQRLTVGELFPTTSKGICACGCGNTLTGRRTRWYSEECSIVCLGVYWVIKGDLQYVRSLMMNYLPYMCADCGKEDYLIEKKALNHRGQEYINFSAAGIQVDHIVPVKDGGSGCWLGNYQFLCHKCNTKKNRKEKIIEQNTTLF